MSDHFSARSAGSTPQSDHDLLLNRVRQSEQRLQTIIDTEPACVKLMSPEGVLLEMNRSGLAMIEASDPAEVVGRPVVDLVHPDDRARFLAAHKTAAAGEPVTIEFRMVGLRGGQRWLEMHAVPFERRAESGQQSPVLSVTNDVTKRKVLEEQLRQSERLQAVGRLAGGVAHDFNNLVTAILGFCDLSLTNIDREHDIYENLLHIRDSAERAVALIQHLLAFSRKQIFNLRVLDLNQIVSRLWNVLPRIIGENVSMITDLDPKLLHVRADPTQLDQILMNLAVNARDAMPKGGSLTVKTTNVKLTQSPVPSAVRFHPGPYVKMTVTDTGMGMDDETVRQIFEPFFTTKDVGEGTGLGLSTVYGIVKQSDGFILAESQVGEGTTFTIYLPATSDDVETMPTPTPVVAGEGQGTVLIVEDAVAVRELTRRTLALAGYHVLVARDAHEAIHIATTQEGLIDLVLTDIIMPGLTGPQLVAQLRGRWPTLRTLYMSGYSEEMLDRNIDKGDTPLLKKPFNYSQLVSAVKLALDSPVPEA